MKVVCSKKLLDLTKTDDVFDFLFSFVVINN